MNVLEKLSAVIKRREAKKFEAISNYDELIVRLADGEDLSPEVIDEALEGAGKSTDELQQAVQLVLQRREWSKQVETEPAVAAKLKEVTQLRETEQAKYRDAKIATEKRIQDLNDEEMRLANELSRLAELRGKLSETCYADIDQNGRMLGKRVYQAQEILRDLEIKIRESAANNLNELRHKKVENDEPLLSLVTQINFRNLPTYKQHVKRLLEDKDYPPVASKNRYFEGFLQKLAKIDEVEKSMATLKEQSEYFNAQRLVVE